MPLNTDKPNTYLDPKWDLKWGIEQCNLLAIRTAFHIGATIIDPEWHYWLLKSKCDNEHKIITAKYVIYRSLKSPYSWGNENDILTNFVTYWAYLPFSQWSIEQKKPLLIDQLYLGINSKDDMTLLSLSIREKNKDLIDFCFEMGIDPAKEEFSLFLAVDNHDCDLALKLTNLGVKFSDGEMVEIYEEIRHEFDTSCFQATSSNATGLHFCQELSMTEYHNVCATCLDIDYNFSSYITNALKHNSVVVRSLGDIVISGDIECGSNKLELIARGNIEFLENVTIRAYSLVVLKSGIENSKGTGEIIFHSSSPQIYVGESGEVELNSISGMAKCSGEITGASLGIPHEGPCKY